MTGILWRKSHTWWAVLGVAHQRWRWFATWLLLAAGAQACAAQAAQAPTDFVVTSQLAELERPLVPPSAGCQLETLAPHVDWAEPLLLSFGASAEPALRVFRVPARIRIQSADSVNVLVDDGVLELAAHADLSRLRLFPRRPLRDQAVVLLPQATLRPLGVSQGKLRLEHRLLGPLRLDGDSSQQLDVACADVALTRSNYDAAASAALIRRLDYAYLRGQQRVTLYPSAEAEMGMRLQVFLAEKEWLELALHSVAPRDGRLLVSYRQGAELIVGWLAEAELERGPQVPAVVSYAGGGKFLVPQGVGGRRCKRALELGVVQGSRSAYAGRLRAGGGFDFAAAEAPDLDAPALVPIHIPQAAWLEVLPGVQLVARAEDLRHCQDPPRAASTPQK